MGHSFLACQTRKMFRLAVLFCCAAFAAAEAEAEADAYYGHGYGLGYSGLRSYGGYGGYGRGYSSIGYSGLRGYAGLGYSRGYYPKADAEADPYYGYGYSGLRSYGGYGGYGRGYSS